MSAITISREAGSLGDVIAEQTALKLHYQLVDKHTFENIFIKYGFVDFPETYDRTDFWSRFDPHISEMANLLKQATLALVKRGRVVLVGRGGFGRFKNYADVLNVRIQAPFSLRMLRTAQDLWMTDTGLVEKYLLESDHIQHEFLQTVYGAGWNTLANFDLLIDTGKVSQDQAVDWLIQAAYRMEMEPSPGLPFSAALKVDPVMVRSVEEVLNVSI